MRYGLLVVISALLLVNALPAPAANFVVNSSAEGAFDIAPGDGICEATPGVGDCTLAAAIDETNALSGVDSIALPAGVFQGSVINSVGDSVVISGAGAAATIIDGDGPDTAIGFQGPDVTFVGVTVQGGTGVNVAGGILNAFGHLTIIDCVIRNNGTTNVGGGIYNDSGRLTVIGTTVTGNHAGNVGGGIYNAGTAEIIESTVNGNSAGNVGGGIHNEGTMEIVNTTVSGNTAGNTSGGVGNEGSMTLNNCTIVGNRAFNTGGGIDTQFTSAQPVVIRNTILSANLPQDCLGEFDSHDGNLVAGWPSSGCGWSNDAGFPAGDLFGVDPMLGPLANNGGPTRTHALLSGSPAINAAHAEVPGSGGDACAATDQRSIDRPGGLRCDIGAFELARCGNGVVDEEEECDDGSNADGDGCDSNCTVTRCGNGVTTSGEECDDANTLDGDCCSSTCTIPPAEDSVTAAPFGAKVAVQMKSKGKLKYQWRSVYPVALADYGDPTTTSDVSICFVDASGAAPRLVASIAVPAGAGWRGSTSGFIYKGLDRGPGSVTKLSLRGGRIGKIVAKGRSPRLKPGKVPVVTPLQVRVTSRGGAASWRGDFDATTHNALDGFTARSR